MPRTAFHIVRYMALAASMPICVSIRRPQEVCGSNQFIQWYIPEWLGHLDTDDQQMVDNPIVRAEGKKSRLMIAENPAGQVVIDLAPCDEGISR